MAEDDRSDRMAQMAVTIYKLSLLLNVPIEEAATIFTKTLEAVNTAVEKQKKIH